MESKCLWSIISQGDMLLKLPTDSVGVFYDKTTEETNITRA